MVMRISNVRRIARVKRSNSDIAYQRVHDRTAGTLPLADTEPRADKGQVHDEYPAESSARGNHGRDNSRGDDILRQHLQVASGGHLHSLNDTAQRRRHDDTLPYL